MLTIKNFELEFPPAVVAAGLLIFEDEYVKKLTETSPGKWTATVRDRAKYQVNVTLSDEIISYWKCTCGKEVENICPHVIATLFTLCDHLDIVSDFDDFDDDDFTEAEQEADLFSSFDRREKAKAAREGFNAILDTSVKIKSLIKERKIAPAWEGCKGILEIMAIEGGLADAIREDAYTVMDTMSEVLDMLIPKADKETKVEMFDLLLEQYAKPNVQKSGYHDFYLIFLGDLVCNPDQDRRYLELLDKLIIDTQSDTLMDYQTISLLQRKHNYLKKKHRPAEAKALLENNLHYPTFRLLYIDQAIKGKDYATAKRLCSEGMKKDYTSSIWESMSDYLLRLHKIAGLENNLPDRQKYTEAMLWECIENADALAYFKKLKALYPAEQWQAKADAIYSNLLNEYEGYSYTLHYLAADVCLIEGWNDRLLSLLGDVKTNLDFISTYAKHFIKQRPAEIIAIYEQAVMLAGVTASSKAYETIATYMKKMLKIEGGTEAVSALLIHFRTNYKNRSAMLNLLKKEFPKLG